MAIEARTCPKCGSYYNASVSGECPYCNKGIKPKETKKTSFWSWGRQKSPAADSENRPITSQITDEPEGFYGAAGQKQDETFSDAGHTVGYYPPGRKPETDSAPETAPKADPVIKDEAKTETNSDQNVPDQNSQPVKPEPLGNRIQALGKTTAKYINTAGGDVSYPAVGWLVCVKGVYYGKTFPLKTGGNRIGRSEDLEVALLKDASVSRKCALEIVFDSRENTFSAILGESRQECRIDGKMLYSNDRILLRGFEEIEIGDTEESMYLFVPLCGEQFSWSRYPGVTKNE